MTAISKDKVRVFIIITCIVILILNLTWNFIQAYKFRELNDSIGKLDTSIDKHQQKFDDLDTGLKKNFGTISYQVDEINKKEKIFNKSEGEDLIINTSNIKLCGEDNSNCTQVMTKSNLSDNFPIIAIDAIEENFDELTLNDLKFKAETFQNQPIYRYRGDGKICNGDKCYQLLHHKKSEGTEGTNEICGIEGDINNCLDISELHGPAGPRGYRGEGGPAGPRGYRGEGGPAGPRGYRGEGGPQGPQGLQGERGPRGYRGEGGPQGPQGDRGPRGYRGEGGASGGDAGDASGGDAGEDEGDTGSGEGEGEGSCQINGTYELVFVSDDQYTDDKGQYSIIVSVSSFTLENDNYNYTQNTIFNEKIKGTDDEIIFSNLIINNQLFEKINLGNLEATITIHKNYNSDNTDLFPVGTDYLYYNQEDCTFRPSNNHNYYFRKTS